MTIVQPESRRTSVWSTAAVGSIGFTALLYVVQVVNALDHQHLDRFGIESRDAEGLIGVAASPLLHAGWPHLLGNTVPVAVLLFLVLVSGIGTGVVATAIIWVVGGLGLWLLGPGHTITVGASGLAFGWLFYLLVRALISRRVGEIALAVGLLLVFGSILIGLLPGDPGVSWQGHLLGAIAGALAAVLLTDTPSERRALPA